MIELRLIWARINREQQVALLDFLAFLEMNLVEVTADARPDFDSFRRFEPPDVFVPLDHFACDRLNDRNNGRRPCLRRLLSAARQCADREHYCAETVSSDELP